MSDAAGMSPDMGVLKARMKVAWMAGDFGKIAEIIEKGAVEFIDRLELKPGETVLDIACGTGNTAIPAARLGAKVTGIDIATNLIEQAQARAAAEGVEAVFEEGDVEDLQFNDASFQTIVTMFGAMFAPRPDVTASEMIRVTRPGGRITMANWTPGAFTGLMFKAGAKHVPPPPGVAPPTLWGDEETVRERLKEGIADLTMTRRKIDFKFDQSPAEVVEFFREYFGPTKVAFSMLDQNGQDALRSDLVDLWTEYNRATDGTTNVESEYLEVIAVRE